MVLLGCDAVVIGQVPIFPRTAMPSFSMLNCITMKIKAQMILQNILNFSPIDNVMPLATLL